MQERHVDDLIDAYMLDALEPDEVDVVETHLEGCERCRALVDEARASRDALLLAPPLAAPPAELRARVLARVAEEQAAAAIQPQRPATPGESPAAANAFERFVRSVLGGQDRHAEHLLHELLSDPRSSVWQVEGTQQAPRAAGKLIGSPD